MNYDEKPFKEINTGKEMTEIKDMLDEGEQILWQGKPNRKSYILSNFLKLLPVAILWLAFDTTFIVVIASNIAEIGGFVWLFVIFFAFHLMPVWMWIWNFVRSFMEIKNIEYAITDKKIILKSGVIAIDFKIFLYSEITGANLRRSIIDKIFKVGDIYINTTSQKGVIYDINQPYQVYKLLQQTSNDIKSDIYYPNAYRPEENNGYHTRYKK